eukprot:TRINITY_DN13985_c0_g1_i1.p1 TRINITY_DN13985_c0_g1~~TRINITY_DN13985_c0_g1_i1.p1  ORF type:complete len:323 (+),score=27.33 TRINITY_DN13985_c0_g1_i1:45-1013(+)
MAHYPPERPQEKRNPRIVHLDLVHSSGRELRRGMEQCVRALVGRLDACDSMQEKMTGVMNKYNIETTDAHGGDVVDTLERRSRQRTTSSIDSNFEHIEDSRLTRAVFVSTKPAYTGFLRSFADLITKAGHDPDIQFLCDGMNNRLPSRSAVLSSLKWLVTGIKPGQHLLFHFIGSTTSDSLILQGGQVISKMALRDLMNVLPPGSKLTMIIDSGGDACPVDLAFSVIAHHTPAQFEMTYGESSRNIGTVVLITAVAEYPGPSITGFLTTSLMTLLQNGLFPTYRSLVNNLRHQFESRVGMDSPVPMVSSNMSFKPEAVVEIV